MGKPEDESPLPSTSLDARGTTPTAWSRCCCLGCSSLRKLVTFRCVFILVLGVAVLLSAVFWLPFLRFRDHQDMDLDYRGYDIVASFLLRHPPSFLEKNSSQLEGDIFAEMSYSSTKVEIISLDPAGSNTTKVVFAVEADFTSRSLIKSLFMTLVTRETFLHLSSGMFGDPSAFEIIKFRGGITVNRYQKAFLLQSVQILFNFTLNFSIHEILENFDELRSQLKIGLRLAPYENLYISLINLKGSTVDPPTKVQSQVYLAVGIPSRSRLKQLAQTIKGSHGKNLGLNNSVFGRVKQVSLSSILQHSLGGDGSPSPSPSPSHQSHRRRRRHHHHHRHHTSVTPGTSPSPSPAATPGKIKSASPPPCHFENRHRYPWKHGKHSHMAPSAPPGYPHSPAPEASPPNIARAFTHPPSKGALHARPPDVMPILSPAPSPSSAGLFSCNAWALRSFPLILLLL